MVSFGDKSDQSAFLCPTCIVQDKLKAFKAAGKKTPAKKADDEAVDETDIYAVADICDIGDGVPLFENFSKSVCRDELPKKNIKDSFQRGFATRLLEESCQREFAARGPNRVLIELSREFST